MVTRGYRSIRMAFQMNRPIRKILKKSLRVFSSRNQTKSGGKEDEEETRRIEFLEGIVFLGVMMRRLNEREKNRNTMETIRHRKEGKRNVECMKMHEHVTCKNKLHYGQKPNPT